MSTPLPHDQYILIDSVNTRYWLVGSQGPPVILLHGLAGSAEDWLDNIEALARQHRVYAVDLVGFGRSDKPSRPYSIPYLAQFLHDFMAAQHLERASLVGHSLGGAVALQYAITFPAQVDRLVLVNAVGLTRELAFMFRVMALPFVGTLMTRPSREATARRLRQAFYDPAPATEERVEFMYQLSALPGAQQALLTTLRSLCGWRGLRPEFSTPIWEGLPTITAPTLVIWGQQDQMSPAAQVPAAVQRLPHARLHVFEQCGHAPQIERPAEFNALATDFLADANPT